jgi:hypothetical protein
MRTGRDVDKSWGHADTSVVDRFDGDGLRAVERLFIRDAAVPCQIVCRNDGKSGGLDLENFPA